MEIESKMDKKKILIRIALLILFIFILNLLAMKFYWYFSIWWFDMPMHILGGFWIGLTLIWFLEPKNSSFSTIIKIILGVLLISIAWEVFEIIVNKTIIQNPFNTLDTISDVCFDLVGAAISIFYFIKKIMIKQSSEI